MLDVNVPALSGDLLVEALRRQHTTSCIVLYSSSDATTMHALAKNAGADGWIQKGTTMEEVVRRLRRLCPSLPLTAR